MKKILVSLFALMLFTGMTGSAKAIDIGTNIGGIYSYRNDVNGYQNGMSLDSILVGSWGNYITRTNPNVYDVSYLRFDLSSIDFSKNLVGNVFLKLYQASSTPSDQNLKMGIYKVNNSYDSSSLSSISPYTILGSNLYTSGDILGSLDILPSSSGGYKSIQLNTSLINEFNKISSDRILTLALDTHLFSGYGSAYFIPNSPSLSLELTSAPVPEPSSMILGLMGIAGMFVRKRKEA